MLLKLHLPDQLVKKLKVLHTLTPDSSFDIDEYFIQIIDSVVSKEIVEALGIDNGHLNGVKTMTSRNSIGMPISPLPKPAYGEAPSARLLKEKVENFEGLGDEADLSEEEDDDDFPPDLRLEDDEKEEKAPLPPPQKKATSKSSRRSTESKAKPKQRLSRSAMFEEMERELEESKEEDTRRPDNKLGEGESPEDAFAKQLLGNPKAKAPKAPKEKDDAVAMPPEERRRGIRPINSKASVSEYTGTDKEF